MPCVRRGCKTLDLVRSVLLILRQSRGCQDKIRIPGLDCITFSLNSSLESFSFVNLAVIRKGCKKKGFLHTFVI